MEKINIAGLLKDCPSGMELNCVTYDNVSFDKVSADEKSVYPIFCYITDEKGNRSGISFTENGCESKRYGAKCVIFPKGKTTWEGFQRPFKDGDVVTYKLRGSLVAFIYKERTTTMLVKSHCALYAQNMGLCVDGDIALKEEEIVFATSEEKQKLFQAIKDNGYTWNAETKTLEKLPEFKAGDILVSRTGNIVLCSNIDDRQIVHYHCILSPFGDLTIRNSIGVGKSFQCTLATDAEKQRLFDKLKSGGYKYNPQTNKLEKLIEPKFKVGDRIKEKKAYISGIITDISGGSYKVEYKDGGVAFATIEFQDGWELVPDKFDIATLKPFDRVLVRTSKYDKWCASFFSHIDKEHHYSIYDYVAINNNSYPYCIPYDGNEHLCGITDDCNNFYKTWE